MVMYHHELECHVVRLLWYLQGHGLSDSSFDQNMTVNYICSELLIPLHPHLVL